MKQARLDESSASMKVARWSAMIITTVVGAAAFVLSYGSLRALAVQARVPDNMAALVPLVIDGTICLGTLGWLVLANRVERRFFVKVMAAGAAVSVAGNSLHAFSGGQDLPPWVCALVAAIAPISLLADAHGLVVLFRVTVPTAPAVRTGPKAATQKRMARAVVLHSKGMTPAQIGKDLGVATATARRYVAMAAPRRLGAAA